MAPLFHVHCEGPEQALACLLGTRPARVLIVGPMGAGKSALAGRAADALAAAGASTACVSADPGLPAFGPPGALSLAHRHAEQWGLVQTTPLCSLDAARFRLPLAQGVARLIAAADADCLMLDAPGVVRGIAGAELLTALAGALAPQVVIWLAPRRQGPGGLGSELAALPAARWRVDAAAAAARPGPEARAALRTRLWSAHTRHLIPRRVALAGLALLGTPPPLDRPAAWQGRLAAGGGDDGRAWMGEVRALDTESLTVALPQAAPSPGWLLVRDAGRDRQGRLVTLGRVRTAATVVPPGPRAAGPAAEVGPASVSVVNGVFGDPLVHLRLRHSRRSLLFDLGECNALPARVLHQVSDVFISHAHADHIGGFIAFLRARIGHGGPCRIYGPPGLAWNIEGFVRGIHWDRIGEAAPAFVVTELHPDGLRCFRVVAGRSGPLAQPACAGGDGVLLREPEFRVRAITLDHGTPVLAFAFEPRGQANVRRERLAALGLRPGPWLTALKRAWLAGERDRTIALPNGASPTVAALAEDLLVTTAGRAVVYATDLADTAENRIALTKLAAGAHTLICEAMFRERDVGQARYTGHLTARACGEIGAAAGVRQLIPFHFSPRYEAQPETVYAEVAAACNADIIIRR